MRGWVSGRFTSLHSWHHLVVKLNVCNVSFSCLLDDRWRFQNPIVWTRGPQLYAHSTHNYMPIQYHHPSLSSGYQRPSLWQHRGDREKGNVWNIRLWKVLTPKWPLKGWVGWWPEQNHRVLWSPRDWGQWEKQLLLWARVSGGWACVLRNQ